MFLLQVLEKEEEEGFFCKEKEGLFHFVIPKPSKVYHVMLCYVVRMWTSQYENKTGTFYLENDFDVVKKKHNVQ